MSFYFSKKTDAPLDEVLTKVADDLKKEGFRILNDGWTSKSSTSTSEVGIQKYRILGRGQSPPESDTENGVEDPGVELSCYVIAEVLPGGTVKVAAVDPGHTSLAPADPLVAITAEQIRGKLYNVIANI
jgi:hypothetical protein